MKRDPCSRKQKATKERVVDGFFYFLVFVSVCDCLFVGNHVEGICGVHCMSNVQDGE
jgi:hypothetical protein